MGGGVSACAICDGFPQNQEVVIVEQAILLVRKHYLSKLCKKVTMLVK
jgi:thioredoxin reductase (NADPH)